jgi:hypothetical protein
LPLFKRAFEFTQGVGAVHVVFDLAN